MIRAEDANPELNGLGDAELLNALGLAEGQHVNIAAILLLGNKSVLTFLNTNSRSHVSVSPPSTTFDATSAIPC